MSMSHKTVSSYWRTALPLLQEKMEVARDRQAESLLENAVALYAFVIEDLDKKWTRGRDLAPYLNPLVILGFDLLRGSQAAQTCLSLATSASNARTSFELRVGFTFISRSLHPATYAEKFARFFQLERLKRHHSGHLPLS